MYRAEFSQPGGAPYLIVSVRAGAYPPGEIAPLGGHFELLPGDICGAASVQLSAPPDLAPGDWLRLYLPGDAYDDPSYLGEITSEPWAVGSGAVECRPLSEVVAKCAWRCDVTTVNGQPTTVPLERSFRPFVQTVLSRCVLPPGITVGNVVDAAAVLRANTVFELLGDTLQAAMPAIEGGLWGVNARGQIVVVARASETTHRFVLGQSERPPGTRTTYANAVRFGYTLPDGSGATFEGRVPEEIALRGEQWDVTSLPASVTSGNTNPLDGQGGAVTLSQSRPDVAGYTRDITVTQPLFDGGWAGHLTDGVDVNGQLLLGPDVRLQNQAESLVQLNGYLPTKRAVRLTLRGRPASIPIQLRVLAGNTPGPWHNGTQIAPPSASYVNGAERFEFTITGDVAFNQTVGRTDIQYEPNAYAAYVRANGQGPPAMEIGSSCDYYDDFNGTGWGNNNPNYVLNINTLAVTPQGQRLRVYTKGPLRLFTYYVNQQGASFIAFAGDAKGDGNVGGAPGDTTRAGTMTFDPRATLNLPGALHLKPGDLVLMSVASGGNVSNFRAVTDAGEVVLTTQAAEGALAKFAVPAELRATAFKMDGNPQQLGRMLLRISNTAGLAAYAYGLLRYRSVPNREWTGSYAKLARVPSGGVAVFETTRGDVELDVQRVTYDLSGGARPVTVAAGSPRAATDDQAVVDAIDSVRRDIRKAGS